ncbi:MAG: alpha-ketoglutarate-dependent dioxygenase AlkB [Bacteroidia bacterium]|nr:alpha-ketoglutarate-dependent dioxygenase AlkB [Bacteroidia bacterium]MDW8347385.1 alpha-ketoglutarate-dependent dioxygenase AlkB [Bacteroidia bacterium]
MKSLLPCDGEVYYYPSFISLEESKIYYKAILNKVEWEQQTITIFGKTYMCPRLSAWYGDSGTDYIYSNILNKPKAWFVELEELKKKVSLFCNYSFNSVLINWYRNEKDSMGWHSDDEVELGKNPVIASISLGASRVCKFRHRFNKKLKHSVLLENGSLLVMQGACQHYWQHAVLKQAKPCMGRINLTFRRICLKD